jgi:hypothetical protein
MRIAPLAPLAEAVPLKLYGGTERVVSWLTEELVGMGHEVALFASGDSTSKAALVAARSWQPRSATCLQRDAGAACRIGLAVAGGTLAPGLGSHSVTTPTKRAVRYDFARPDRRARYCERSFPLARCPDNHLCSSSRG